MNNIRIAGIEEDSIVDGPGLRAAVFLQGCDKRCEGCQNPETWPVGEGGTLMSAGELWAKISANPLTSGVTLSGGEPLLQAKALLPLAENIKEAKLDLAIYTGDTIEQILERNDEAQINLLSLADTLIDGPFILAEKSLALPFRGSSNQRILDLKESIKKKKPIPTTNPDWFPRHCERSEAIQ
jgi:anaerobic ribonucleoside-triphosphate reductase activating protein